MSKWYSTPNAKRKRKNIMLTLSDEARAKLERLAGVGGSRSAVVEELIMKEQELSFEHLQAIVAEELKDGSGMRGVLLGLTEGGGIRVYAVVSQHSRELSAFILEAEERLSKQFVGRKFYFGVRALRGEVTPESLAPDCKYIPFD